jgi:diaminohydroxyphosphoribosylaminopyrimidine deaminase/5-amino-6-(5-phosphoribosylamino)uracil reductase
VSAIPAEGVAADSPIDACWQALLHLAAQLAAATQPVRHCWLRIGQSPQVALDTARPPRGDGWRVLLLLDAAAADELPPPAGESRYLLEDLILLRLLERGDLPAAAAALLETYAPYALAAVHARRAGRAFAVSHFAQSLDGRIAAGGGGSKWIGCLENRRHAHRMRALCDGILIGTGTLRADRPALTVRHVPGRDPARIVVGAAGPEDVACLLRAGPGRVLLLHPEAGAEGGGNGQPGPPQVERLALPRSNGRISAGLILETLYRRDVRTVYVEGGAATTSAFLADGALDVLQLHIAPLILGAGVSSFSCPEIRQVAESVRFTRHAYRPVGDGILFVGRLG